MAQDDDRSGLVQVELDADQVAQRAAKLASEELERGLLLEKKRSHNREWNEQLKQSRERITVLANEVDSGKAWVPAQEDLFNEDGEAIDEPPARRRRGRRAAAANDGASA